MKSKIKQLLVGVLTVAVISSNFAAALIPGAATITGTIAVTENKTVVASTTDTTVDVPVMVTFSEPVTGPHGRFSITADGATLTGIEVDSFDNANAKENPDAYVRIGDEYGDDGTNLETGTILVESAIDNKAAVVTYINLVATFTVPANTAAGTVIPVTVKGIDTTNANEDNWEDLAATNGKITVEADVTHEAAADWSYDDTNHWHACVVEGCTEHIGENAYDYAEHSYDAGVVTDPTTTSKGYTTYTCECGYSYTDNEVDELAVAFVPYYDPTASTLRVHYEYPADSSALMKKKLVYAKAQGNRKIEYILTIEGKDYSFEMDKINSGWFIQVANFGIHDTYLDAEICIKISWGGEDPGSWTTNSLDFNISKLVAAGKIEDTSNSATDTIVALSDDIINAYNAMITEYEKLSETDYIVMSSGVSTEEGYISYAVNYYPKSTDIQITYTYGDDFKNDVLTPAKGQGTDKRAISYKMSVCDSDPYVFEMTKISSGLYVQPAGFTIHDLDNIKVWLHVEGYDTDNTEVVHDTNAVTLNINEGIATDSSAFAVAYTAFMKLI